MTRQIDVYTGYNLHPAQQQVFDSRARFKVIACGRRFGKTELAKIGVSQTAGEGFPAAYFAPSYKLLEEVWDALLALLRPAITDKNEQMHKLHLVTGGVIDCWSLTNPQSGLGHKYKRVVIDEFATGEYKTMWERVIRPTLTDYRGEAWFPSTPRGMNFYFDLHNRGLVQNRGIWKDWESFSFPTAANPYIDPEEIEEAEKSLPAQIFAQEYMAQFVSDADAVFRNLERCWFAEEQEERVEGHAYFIGWDVARVNDFSVMAVIDATLHQLVKLDVSPGIAFEMQMGRLWNLIEKFNPLAVVVEDNANLKLIEDLQSRSWPVIPFHTTMASKMILVDQLALSLERETIQILKDDALIAELQAYRHSQLPGGGIRYSAPEGRHDDRVMALMLANWASSEEYAGEADYFRFG